VYIIKSTGLGNIVDEVAKIPPLYLTDVVILPFPRVAVSTYKWRYIAKL